MRVCWGGRLLWLVVVALRWFESARPGAQYNEKRETGERGGRGTVYYFRLRAELSEMQNPVNFHVMTYVSNACQK